MVLRNNWGTELTQGQSWEGVDTVVLIIDYINQFHLEIEDPTDPASTKAGQGIVRNIINSYVNILSSSDLINSRTEQCFLVRRDGVTTTMIAQLQAAIRAVDTSQMTAGGGLSSMTVTASDIATTTAEANLKTQLPA